jgi:hypothetical protein
VAFSTDRSDLLRRAWNTEFLELQRRYLIVAEPTVLGRIREALDELTGHSDQNWADADVADYRWLAEAFGEGADNAATRDLRTWLRHESLPAVRLLGAAVEEVEGSLLGRVHAALSSRWDQIRTDLSRALADGSELGAVTDSYALLGEFLSALFGPDLARTRVTSGGRVLSVSRQFREFDARFRGRDASDRIPMEVPGECVTLERK